MKGHHEIIRLPGVSPQSMRGIFSKKSFLWVMGGQTFLGKLAGRELVYMRGLIIRSVPSGEWGHSLQPPPPHLFLLRELNLQPNVKKKKLERISILRGMLLGKRGWPCSRGDMGCSFYIKIN